jgi:hypothetical protein
MATNEPVPENLNKKRSNQTDVDSDVQVDASASASGWGVRFLTTIALIISILSLSVYPWYHDNNFWFAGGCSAFRRFANYIFPI